MDGKKLAIFMVAGTIAACVLIYLAFLLYFNINPTQN